jgi:hypothetical protein
MVKLLKIINNGKTRPGVLRPVFKVKNPRNVAFLAEPPYPRVFGGSLLVLS